MNARPAALSPAPAEPPRAVLGVDVGGTKIAGGLVRLDDMRLLARRQIATPPRSAGDAALVATRELIRELSAEATTRTLPTSAIGLAICEIVDRAGALRSGQAVDWQEPRALQRFRRLAPTFLEADVRAAALAEARLGAGRHFSSFVYVTIGTGVSSCLVLDGQPYRGARGATGTLASSPLPVEVDSLDAATAPTLEQIGSGPGLVNRYRQCGGHAESAEEVLAAASRGDLLAVAAARQGAQAVGAAIGWLVNILDPEAVILGGGLGLTEGLYRDALVPSVRRHVWWNGHRNLPILSATTGLDAGILGAAFVAADGLARPTHVPERNPSGSPARTEG